MAAFVTDSRLKDDFDNDLIYQKYESAVLNLETLNIAIDFNNDGAFAEMNINSALMKEVLQSEVRE